MESKIILLRKELTPRNLAFHLKRFFRNTTFSSDYISIQIQVVDKNNELNRFNLVEKTVLNVKRKKEIISYIEYSITELSKYLSKQNANNIGKLNIKFMPISKEDYKAFFDLLFKIQIKSN